jgi:hypothetical protein
LHDGAPGALLTDMSRYDAPSRLSTPPRRRKVARGAARPLSEEESWAWANSHRGRPATSPPPAAARAAGKVMRPLSARFGPGLAELEEHWAAIIGEALANYTRPEKYQGGAAGLTLVIRARGPAAALAEAQAPQILERVARYAGKAPKKLKIVQGPLTAEAAPARAKTRRVTKVKAFTPEPRGLDAVLETFEAAVRGREAGRAAPSSSKEQD